MRKLIAALAIAGLTVGLAQAQTEIGRLFFQDKADYMANNGGADLDSELGARGTPDVLTYANPDGTAASARYYLFWESHLANMKMNSIDIDIRAVGAGNISAWNIYNTNISIQTRWNGIGNKTGGAAVSEITQIAMINVTQFGVQNNATANTQDPHYNRNVEDGGSVRGTTLLGWVDVARTGASVELFIDVGPALIARSGGNPNDRVFFGFGDASVQVSPANNTSTAFDARLTPEPASLALLGLGALALRRRR